MSCDAIIIIGAPRSGTNMLRDALTALPGYGTWPCDEINYIWRHGNVRYPSDEFTADLARPEVSRYIRKQFERIARATRADIVVEKTCANTLRVDFVDRVIPDARYICIRRDGYDVVGSAMKRWRAPLDLRYTLRKARYVPIQDMPYYATRYIWNRLYLLSKGGGTLAFWGPAWNGMPLLGTHLVEELCALQWQVCLERSHAALSRMEQSRWVDVTYEAFVRDPARELARILDHLQIPVKTSDVTRAVAGVSSDSIGKGRRQLGEPTIARLEALVGETQRRFGYA